MKGPESTHDPVAVAKDRAEFGADGLNTPTSISARTKDRGLTLIELVITLVIGGILAGLAYPAFQQFVESANARQGLEDLASGFLSARTMAVTNGVNVRVCALNGNACSNNPDHWKTGWAVFEDCDGDGVIDDASDSVACTPANSNVTTASPEPVFARGKANEATWTVTEEGGAAGPAVFTFQPNGRAFSTTNNWPIRFSVSIPSSEKKSLLVVSILGQVCVELRDSGECDEPGA